MNQVIWMTWTEIPYEGIDRESIRVHFDEDSARQYANQYFTDMYRYESLIIARTNIGSNQEPEVIERIKKPEPPTDPNSPAYKLMMDLYSTPSLAEISASSSFKDDADLNCTDSVIYPELKNDDEK